MFHLHLHFKRKFPSHGPATEFTSTFLTGVPFQDRSTWLAIRIATIAGRDSVEGWKSPPSWRNGGNFVRYLIHKLKKSRKKSTIKRGWKIYLSYIFRVRFLIILRAFNLGRSEADASIYQGNWIADMLAHGHV